MYSGVTTSAATPAIQGQLLRGGGGAAANYRISFVQQKIVQLGSKMHHIAKK